MEPNDIRLEALRAEVDKFDSVAAFARQFDLDVTYIRQLLNGHRSVGERAAMKMGMAIAGNASYVGLKSISERKYGEIKEFPKQQNSVVIPYLAAVASMGEGIDLASEDSVVDRMTLKRDWLRQTLPGIQTSGLAIISGKGDSMAPTFGDGDLLLIDTSIQAVDIDAVYVLSAHGRLFIKRVRQRLDGHFEISSDNPIVRTVDILNGDHEVTVHGRVVWAWNGKRL
jgi:phage repressor protein C with HTH and peptisase S24 domain